MMASNTQDLRSQRLKKGLELRTVSERTGIRIGVLQALEAGRYDEIGAACTVESLRKAYYQALEADPGKSADTGNSFAGMENPVGTNHREALDAILARLRRWRAFALFLSVLVVAGGLAVVFWAGKIPEYFIVSKQKGIEENTPSFGDLYFANPSSFKAGKSVLQRLKTPGQETRTTSLSTTNNHAETDSVKENSSIELEPFISGANFKERRMLSGKTNEKFGQHTLNVKAIAECWIQFKIDGGKRRSELLHPGETRSWKVKRDARLTVGNAGGILLEWDGKVLGPGKTGRVLRISLPEDMPQAEGRG